VNFRRAKSVAWEDPVVRGWTARFLTLPLTAVASFGATAVAVNAVGATAYGYVALIATITALLPFADLGLGSTVQTASAVAADPATDPEFDGHLLSAIRLLFLSAAVLIIGSTAAGLWGVWRPALHVPARAGIDPNVVAPLVVAAFAIALPFSIGQRILLGRSRTELAVGLSASASLFALLSASGLALVNAPVSAYAVVPSLSIFVAAVLGAITAAHVTRVRLGALALRAVRVRAFPGRGVVGAALPMLVVMVGLPIALQSDRIVLAHRASASALAQYALAAQVYATVWGVVYSGGVALWAKFARERSSGVDVSASWRRAFEWFAAAGLFFAVPTGFALPWIVRLVSGGSVQAPASLSWAFAGLLAIHTAHLPSAMLLTTRTMLWFQACCVVLMLGINLPLSWVLARPMGAAGPVLASVVAVASAQLGTGWVVARWFSASSGEVSGRSAVPVAQSSEV
jgi:O-antigen/teichoic acid export membrane protein